MDISVPLRSGMVRWPGDPEVIVERYLDIGKGDGCTARRLSMSAHTGTHMDAPLHFLADGASLDAMPLDAAVGIARVIEIANPARIERGDLEPHRIEPGDRLLLKTANSARACQAAEFRKDFVALTAAAAAYLVDCRIRCVGIDSVSIGAFEGDGAETHRILLGAGVWILEGLNLAGISAGQYELVCLPLRVLDADGAPARAILRAIK